MAFEVMLLSLALPPLRQKTRTSQGWGTQDFGRTALAAEPSAIDDQDVAVHVIACIRGKKDRSTSEIRRQAPAAHGNPGKNGSGARGVCPQSGGIVSGHIAGSDGVDVDALVAPFICQRLGQLRNRTLGR